MSVIDLGKVRGSETELFKGTISTQKVGSSIVLNDTIDKYDYLFIQYESDSGGNFPTQIIKPASMITKRITIDSFNIADSKPDGAWLYEFTMVLQNDNKTLQIEKANGVKLFSTNENIATIDFGVRFIYGVKLGGTQ